MGIEPTEVRPGRPTKYDPAYCDQVVEFMGRGYSMAAFAGHISVARSTLNEWMGEHPEFSEAVNVGKAKRTLSLETTLLAGETGPKVTAHIFALKHACPEEWRDRREIDHTVREAPAEEMTEEELLAIAAGSRC